MHWFTIICDLALAVYLVWESARSPAVYRKLKQAVDSGDARARTVFYYSIYWFEGVSAALAFAALGFDWRRFDPSNLGLRSSSLGLPASSAFTRPFVITLTVTFVVGLAVGAIALKILPKISAKPSAARQRPSRFVPDFSYLMPTSRRERLLFALVAVSAGVCEEVVFRAWLLNRLHQLVGLGGWTLVLAAAVLFGAAHYYQGIAGVMLTSFLGAIFCGLYVVTGTLLVPIALHVLVDLRWAVFPSMPALSPQPRS